MPPAWGLPGVREMWGPRCPEAEGAFPHTPAQPSSLVPTSFLPKPPNNGPFLSCLGGQMDAEALKGSRNAGDSWHDCRAQAPVLGRWKGRHIPPGVPQQSFPCCLLLAGSLEGAGKPMVLHAPKSRVPASTGSGEAGASTPSPLRRWFSMPEPDLGILS